MKKLLLFGMICLTALIGSAKDLKTLRVTTLPQMSCSNCENKIKKNIRFEKGVHQISTDLKGQVVTVVYDADKTDEEKIIKAFDKIKYKAIILDEGCNSAAADSCRNCSKATDKN
ncbi:MAG: cation transporter [Bacteroides sp.]|nr:cation transporter [Bacteroides sp.]